MPSRRARDRLNASNKKKLVGLACHFLSPLRPPARSGSPSHAAHDAIEPAVPRDAATLPHGRGRRHTEPPGCRTRVSVHPAVRHPCFPAHASEQGHCRRRVHTGADHAPHAAAGDHAPGPLRQTRARGRRHPEAVVTRAPGHPRAAPLPPHPRPAACRPASALPRRHNGGIKPHDGGARVTGTFYGHRRARIALAVQERPGSLPTLVLELGVPTGKLMQEISAGGHVRIALECEKKSKKSADGADNGGGSAVSLLEEAMWTAYVNGRRVGYAVRREATDGDLAVMQLLSTVSAGAGVLPGDVVDHEPPADGAAEADGEVAYMRAGFDRVTGSKDSESFYMVSPDGDGSAGAAGGTELSIFFVRV